MTVTTTKPVSLCAICKTTEGSRRSNGQFVRYRAERFGLEGELCATCRSREMRHQAARHQGREPGKVGRPERPWDCQPEPRKRRVRNRNAPYVARPLTAADLSAKQVSDRLAAVRRQAELEGRRPMSGVAPLEDIRRAHWASKADEARRAAYESRRLSLPAGVLR